MDVTSQHVMNFLNEVSSLFPSAVSLASGRPNDRFLARLKPQVLLNSLAVYERHSAGGHGGGQVWSQLLQYGRTAGVISELVAQQVRSDERVPARADGVLITAGCQEALALCVPALCPEPSDVLLVCNPTYIGAIGAANVARVPITALCNSAPSIADAIEFAVPQLRRNGRRARAIYLIPDFDNPTGRVLDTAARRDILQVCARHRIVVLEDNPYGLFRYEGDAVPPMAALDEVGSVIYLSTFSKTSAQLSGSEQRFCPRRSLETPGLPGHFGKIWFSARVSSPSIQARSHKRSWQGC